MANHTRAEARAAQVRAAQQAGPRLYSSEDIVDAPEYHEYARAMGLLTWGTWDADVRPFEERLKDFLQAHPADAPARFQGSMLAKTPNGEYGPAPQEQRLERLQAIAHWFGSLTEVLARYALKSRNGPQYVPCEIGVAPFREVTRIRNQRLRALHGRVDIEADNMDEAKAAELERLEKKRAAEQIREARGRMRRETESDK
jgi:hypothetical protein